MKQYDLFELIWKAQAPENSDVKADLQADFLYEDGEMRGRKLIRYGSFR